MTVFYHIFLCKGRPYVVKPAFGSDELKAGFMANQKPM